MPAFPGTDATTLVQDGVLWKFTGTDRRGEPTVDIHNPVAIRCWETKSTEKVLLKAGTVPATEGNLVQTVLVDRPIPLYSRLWIGSIQSLPTLVFDGNGGLLASQMQILKVVGYDESLDKTQKNVTRTASCEKYNVPTPTIPNTTGT